MSRSGRVTGHPKAPELQAASPPGVRSAAKVARASGPQTHVAAAPVPGGPVDASIPSTQDFVNDVKHMLSGDDTIHENADMALFVLDALTWDELEDALTQLGDKYIARLRDNLPEEAKVGPRYLKLLVALDARQAFDFLQDVTLDEVGSLIDSMGAVGRSKVANELRRPFGLLGELTLRVLFDHTPASEINTLQRWAQLAFGKPFGKATSSPGEPGKDWNKLGLGRAWDALAGLPQAHVTDNQHLISMNRYESAGLSGWANLVSGEAAIGYHNSNDLLAPQSADANDPLHQVNRFDWVVRHEIGHRVDPKVRGNGTICRMATAGDWRTYTANAAWQPTAPLNQVADDLVTASDGPINREPNRVRTSLVQEIQWAIDSGDQGRPRTELPKSADFKPEFLNDDAITVVEKSLSYQNPWATGNFTELSNGRVFHESYPGVWVSYVADARVEKVSNYQFRSPLEWFAEAYAAYYEPTDNLLRGRNNDAADWFDNNVDNIV